MPVLLTPRMVHGTVTQLLQQPLNAGGLDELEVEAGMGDLMAALSRLHAVGLVHRCVPQEQYVDRYAAVYSLFVAVMCHTCRACVAGCVTPCCLV
jgi:hypothetical protein